jgi:hypothetical protein
MLGHEKAHLETWDFGHPGWLNESASGHIVSPVHENNKFEVLAWTPSTNGKIEASALRRSRTRGDTGWKRVSRFSEIGLTWITPVVAPCE